MNKIMTAIVALLAAGLVWAKGVEQVSIVENEITTITVPFGIKDYTPSNKDVVRIEAISDTSLRVTAIKRGRCDLDVRGDKGLEQKFEITVLGDLATVLDTLTTELDSVQEVRARIVGNSIRIDGEIGSIAKWEYLTKVLKGYNSSVRNFATFSPGPEILIRLKETLQQVGFDVVFQSLGTDRKAWKAKTIALDLNKKTRIMNVQGRVYTPEQKEQVLRCLSTERWLSMKGEASQVEDYRIRGMIDVFVDTPKIRLSVAYMAIGESDLKKIGNPVAANTAGPGVLSLDGAFSTVYDLIRGTHHGGGDSASVGATLGVTARFFKNNGITRVSDTGYTMLESWSEKGAKFKSGGTMFVRPVSVQGSGSVAMSVQTDLKEIPYGFQLDVKGGLISPEVVDVDINFMRSTVTHTDTETYDRKEDSSQQKISLPIGRTTFIGGVKMISDDRVSPSGLPILRNTPMLNWFVADSGTEISDRRLVIMVCPEIIDGSRDGNLKVEEEVNIPVSREGIKPTEQREEEKKPFHGFWYWLNWFTF